MISVVAIEFDSTAEKFGQSAATASSGVKSVFTDPTFLWSLGANLKLTQVQLSIAAVCFILAIALEALGDYFAARKDESYNTHVGADLVRLQEYAAAIGSVRRFIRKQSLQDLIALALATEVRHRTAIEEQIEVAARTDRDDATTQAGEFDEEEQRSFEEQAEFLFRHSYTSMATAQANITLFRRIRRDINAGRSRLISNRDRSTLYRYVEERCWTEMLNRASTEAELDIREHASDTVLMSGEDLMAVLGLSLSAVVFLATGAAVPEAHGNAIIGLVIGIVLLGALGSSARVLFIIPMIRKVSATATLVPPVYAVRPIVLLLLILAFQRSGLASLLSTNGIAPMADNLSVSHNEGWFVGALLAAATAICSWKVSYNELRLLRQKSKSTRLASK